MADVLAALNHMESVQAEEVTDWCTARSMHNLMEHTSSGDSTKKRLNPEGEYSRFSLWIFAWYN